MFADSSFTNVRNTAFLGLQLTIVFDYYKMLIF